MGNLTSYYNDFVVYDMRSAFSKEPSDIQSCPFCKTLLIRTKLKASSLATEDSHCDSLLPVYESTHSFKCPCCHWWCVREKWTLYELTFGSYDYLITGLHQRYKVFNLFEPLMLATEILMQDPQQKFLLSKEIKEQELVIANAMKPFFQPIKVEYIGSGLDENGAGMVGLYYVTNNETSFLLIIRQSLTGWINFEAVEIINGLYPVNNGTQDLVVTSVKQINGHGRKSRLKSRTYQVTIHNPNSPQSLFSNIKEQELTSWDIISQAQSLYDDVRKLPDFVCVAFLNDRSD
jgi:hypothetical protein